MVVKVATGTEARGGERTEGVTVVVVVCTMPTRTGVKAPPTPNFTGDLLGDFFLKETGATGIRLDRTSVSGLKQVDEKTSVNAIWKKRVITCSLPLYFN